MARAQSILTNLVLFILTFSVLSLAIRRLFFTMTYEAPIQRPGKVENEVPGHFRVHLHPGHTLEQHSALIGFDIEKYKYGQLNAVYPDRIVYYAKEINTQKLAAVRADSGVEYLSPDYKINRPDLGWEGGPDDKPGASRTESPKDGQQPAVSRKEITFPKGLYEERLEEWALEG
jgi:hypothetical protein